MPVLRDELVALHANSVKNSIVTWLGLTCVHSV